MDALVLVWDLESVELKTLYKFVGSYAAVARALEPNFTPAVGKGCFVTLHKGAVPDYDLDEGVKIRIVESLEGCEKVVEREHLREFGMLIYVDPDGSPYGIATTEADRRLIGVIGAYEDEMDMGRFEDTCGLFLEELRASLGDAGAEAYEVTVTGKGGKPIGRSRTVFRKGEWFGRLDHALDDAFLNVVGNLTFHPSVARWMSDEVSLVCRYGDIVVRADRSSMIGSEEFAVAGGGVVGFAGFSDEFGPEVQKVVSDMGRSGRSGDAVGCDTDAADSDLSGVDGLELEGSAEVLDMERFGDLAASSTTFELYSVDMGSHSELVLEAPDDESVPIGMIGVPNVIVERVDPESLRKLVLAGLNMTSAWMRGETYRLFAYGSDGSVLWEQDGVVRGKFESVVQRKLAVSDEAFAKLSAGSSWVDITGCESVPDA